MTRPGQTLRIYGKTIHEWKVTDWLGHIHTLQIEVEYKDYNEAGELVGTGSEDFSLKRFYDTVYKKYVYTWDGIKRNKGGHRWFDCQCLIAYRKADKKLIKSYLAKKYKAEIIELR